MLERIARRRRSDDHGFALITVILVMMVMSALTAVMVNNLVSTFNGTSHQVQVTNALTAADAGVTDMVYQLQQGTNWSTFPTSYPGLNIWPPPPGSGYYGWKTVGNGQYRAHVDPCGSLPSSRQTSSGCNSQTDEVVTVQGQYPANTGTTQAIQAIVRYQAGGPAAFNFAMFADKGIQIHNHGSPITPTIVTTSMHSNGFITLNYPGLYRVGEMEASGKITIADGGGSSEPGPYSWPYWISGSDASNPQRCYPALQYPALQYPSGGVSNNYWEVPTQNGSTWSCPGNPQWSLHASVVGDIYANSVEVKQNGDTQQPACETTDLLLHTAVTSSCPQANGNQWTPQAYGTGCAGTGQPGFQDAITGSCIKDDPGNITAGSVKFDSTGQTFNGLAGTGTTGYTYARDATACANAGDSQCNQTAGDGGSPSSCSACNQGPGDTGGSIGGQLNLNQASWAPGSINFPSLNFRDPTTGTLPTAEVDSGNAKTSTATCTTGSTCHVFAAASDFLTWMQTSTNVYYPGANVAYDPNTIVCPTQWCMTWLTAAQGGHYYYTNTPASVAYVLLRGNYELTGSGNLTLSVSSLRSAFKTPSTAITPTVMVAGALVNETGGINLTASLTVVGPLMDPFNPLQPDSQLSPGTVPGLLASGGTGTAIQSTDYDTDSPWSAYSNYQGLYRNQVIVRGLVYTGAWSSSANASTASDQHWHNGEPKNAQIIIGAQIGGTLHDCSNFTFSYDSLIENIRGFTGSTAGSIYVVDWTQL